MYPSHATATILELVLDMALRSTVLLIVAGGIVLALRHRAAATRHLVWGLALGGVVLLPLLCASLPRWPMPGLPTMPSWTTAGFQQSAGTESQVQTATRPSEATASQPSAPSLLVQPARTSDEAAAPSDSPAPARRHPAVTPTGWLVTLWVAGALAVLATILLGLWRSARLARHADPVHDGMVLTLAQVAAGHLGLVRHVQLLQAPRPVMPMTWGALRPVVLLPADRSGWTRPQLEAVLLHELAHVKRHDYVTQLVAGLACALCWFHPLVWLAAWQLRVEREHACDDLVLRAGSRASDYAQQLLDIARSLRASPVQAVAAIAMARPSQLAGRLLAVLDGSRPRGVATRRLVARAAAAAALIVVPVAGASAGHQSVPSAAEEQPLESTPATTLARDPLLPPRDLAASSALGHVASYVTSPQTCDWENGEQNSASTNINDDRLRIRLEMDPDCRITLDASGKVRFSNDFTDVAGLDRSGSFALEEREGHESHRLEIEPGQGNALVRRWYVDGQLQQGGAGEADARQWLARTLTIVFRRTGYQAQERGTWILSQGGVPALLAEIGHMRSDYAMGTYYGVLLAQKQLDPATVTSVVEDAGRRIHSDYALSKLLQAVAEHQAVDHTVEVAYVTAAGHISSDYEKEQALSAILKRPGLRQDVADAMLREATKLSSDYELAKLLKELIAAHPIGENMTPVFFQAVSSIGSDYERHGVLRAMLEKGAPSQDVLDRTLEAAQGMSSDYELATLLLEVAQKYPVDQALPASYITAARSLGSDHEQGRVWAALLDRKEISPTALTAALDAASGIHSDFELSALLRAFLARHALDDATRPAFFRAVGGMDSDYETARVLTAALDAKPLARATVLDVIKASTSIESDHDLGELLIHVTDVVPLDDEIRAQLRAACDRIGSSYTRGQVLAKIYPRGTPA